MNPMIFLLAAVAGEATLPLLALAAGIATVAGAVKLSLETYETARRVFDKGNERSE